MSERDDYRRDVAGRFSQAARNATFKVMKKLFPQLPSSEIAEEVMRKVEEQGLLVQNIDVMLGWFRSDADAEWLDAFWKSPEGARLIELTVELFMRAQLRQYHPDVEVPPPSGATS